MKTAVLIPCYNEALTVEKVIKAFRDQLPAAQIYVYDNNSTDGTGEFAMKAGAIVKKEYRQGKANVVRSMFRDVDADIFIITDGDDTYPADEVKNLLHAFEKFNADMVIGDRFSKGSIIAENQRHWHRFGNNLVRYLINKLFDVHLSDIMSGYRVFSKKFVKNYPVFCKGFELETEMTIFALNHHLFLVEVPITIKERPKGSFSKLNTFSDGRKIMATIFNLFRYYRPLVFFGTISVVLIIVSMLIGIPVVIEFFKFHYVYKVPSAILASSIMLLAILSYVIGLILDTITTIDKKNFLIRLNTYR
jgi:glycosyltransferase involved in cell wall biosynthesis